MPLSGVFEKKTNAVAKRVLDFYEDIRYKYLSALDDPKEYGEEWKSAVKKLRTDFDGLGDFTAELKKYLDEDNVFDDDVNDVESPAAKKLYSAIKELRFKSKEMNDPFARQLGDKVIETLVKKPSVYAMFIHYALRSHAHALDRKVWERNDIKPDEITEGAIGLDLELKDIPLYITEHYGDDVDTSRVKSKFEGALKLLEEVYLTENSQDSWDKLVAVDIKKEEEEKSEEEKSEIEFLIPNKPMYRIFEIGDLKELKGFSGEWLVQEKFDGIRIQIHKKKDKVSIYTYNEKDITDKCKDIVEKAEQKRFGDMILDAELILYDDDEPLHRADTIAHLFKNKYKDATLKARIFDIMNHDGKDLTDTPLKERINILFYQLTPGSSDLFNFPSKKNTRIADSIAEVEKYSKSLMESKTSEGVVIKDIESTYYIGSKKNPKWVKWKKFVDLDVIVLDKKKTKSNLYSYTVGVGPLSGEEAREHNGTEIEGKTYLEVGKALNTKESVDIGAIVRVKVDEVRRKGTGYSLYSAKVIEIPEVESPEKLITLELLSKEGRKSLKYDIEDALLKYTITDGIHGKADIIMKSDLDGFTIYGFEGDSLMQKNALADIDLWKEQLGEMIKSKTSDARMSIKNYLIEEGRPTELKDIFRWANENIPDLTQKLWEGDFEHFSSWMKDFNGDFKQVGKTTYTENPVMITKKDESKQALYKLSIREDDNLELVITYKDEDMVWIIDIKDSEDIYNLFGKSGKFPAQIGERSQPSKLLDKGALTLGVQKHGYHEYKLDGDKFRTRLHFRVVPVQDQDKWVVWTGVKQKMLDTKEDEGIWDITEDRFKKLTMQID